MPTATGASDTYYCDYTSIGASAGFARGSGSGNDGSGAGAFYLSIGSSSSNTYSSRIMYV